MLFEHVNASGEVDERVRAVEGSPSEAQLLAKAQDAKSGWRVATSAEAEQSKPKTATGRGSAVVDLTGGERK